MEVAETGVEGLLVITLHSFADDRGVIREFYRESAWRDAGLPVLGPWAQFNVTDTGAGTIRGLHGEAMHKLVGVASGEAFGAYVDLREGSSTFRKVETVPLRVGTQVLVPNGVCNGFQATSDGGCAYLYCFDREWQQGMEGVAVNALDPELGIAWPVPVDPDDPAKLSARDRSLPTLAEVLADRS
ncbi:MAG TPA: dTDP-4-dehydrorhamnose 3,5-epimerase [Acidimicrobiia bacterium]|nr:dTDP-4-dehydrorhamnose 3,5-epimerase [Acidimicrobiia bacterium]